MNLIPWKEKNGSGEIRKPVIDFGINRLRQEMDQMFDRFFSDPFAAMPGPLMSSEGWMPSLDISETDNEVTVSAELPGMDPKDLDITISGNVLTLSGEKQATSEDHGHNWYHAERKFGSFRRNVQLPSSVDTDKVRAEHRNGVLTVHLGKLSSVLPKRVPVNPG